ncbi:hypothetical protein WJX81_005059 [Elliptochloris bilobata]|uniref:Uncharacterized protein n=1 Tax=Elliptochloris bilobata TaxID=381761 RepID=A0AAW1R2C5_9CHLO
MRAGAAALAAGLLQDATAQCQEGASAEEWEEGADAGEASLGSVLAVLALLQELVCDSATARGLAAEDGLVGSLLALIRRGCRGEARALACAAAAVLATVDLPDLPRSLCEDAGAVAALADMACSTRCAREADSCGDGAGRGPAPAEDEADAAKAAWVLLHRLAACLAVRDGAAPAMQAILTAAPQLAASAEAAHAVTAPQGPRAYAMAAAQGG